MVDKDPLLADTLLPDTLLPDTLLPETLDVNDAAPSLRDEFLRAIDTGNQVLSRQIATHLTRCRNPLPGMVCVALGLTQGSTYGRAARLVLRA